LVELTNEIVDALRGVASPLILAPRFAFQFRNALIALRDIVGELGVLVAHARVALGQGLHRALEALDVQPLLGVPNVDELGRAVIGGNRSPPRLARPSRSYRRNGKCVKSVLWLQTCASRD